MNMSNYKSLLKDTVIFAVGSLGSKVILFLLVPLYTNYLSSAEYGTAELITTIASLFIPILCLAINTAEIRYGLMKNVKAENVAVASFFVLILSALLTLMLVPMTSLYPSLYQWRWYLAFYIVVSSFAEVERTYLKVKGKNKLFAIIGISKTAVLALANILLLVVAQMRVEGYLLAIIFSYIFEIIITYIASGLYLDLPHGTLDVSLLRRMIGYSAPLILSSISWWLIHSSDKIMLDLMIGSSMLGIYTAATKIPSLINVFNGFFNQAWAIFSFKEVDSNNNSRVFSTTFGMFCTFLTGLCLMILSFVKPFMSAYVGKEFQEAWLYTPFLLVSAVLAAFSAILSTVYSALEKTRAEMWTTLLCALINIAVNFVGIKRFGIWGAVAGTFAAYFVCSSIRLVDINRRIRICNDYGAYIVNVVLLVTQAAAVSFQWHVLVVSSFVFIIFVLVNRKILQKGVKRLLAYLKRSRTDYP